MVETAEAYFMGSEQDEREEGARKSAGDPGTTEEYPVALAARIGSLFDVPAPLEAYDFPERGNINQHTFLIHGGRPGSTREYLLQRINQKVFTRPRNVMAAMLASVEAQKRNLASRPLPPGREWETIDLIPTRKKAPYLEFESKRGLTYWRLMGKISRCRTCKSLGEIPRRKEQLQVAEEAGRGLALYGDFTSGMDISKLVSPLPGYRDTRVYYDQFLSVLQGNRTPEEAEKYLPRDRIVRESTEEHFLIYLDEKEYRKRMKDPQVQTFIDLARTNETFGMTLLEEMAAGRIRTVAIHGDTKLDNFLFSTHTGKVKALVDLDTIMPHTWLVDWGDMLRSLTNVAGEKERDLSRVQVDMEIYEAVARGFLSTAREITPEEVNLMVEAVQIIALELGLRFLTDYLRGNSYFKLGRADPPDLNKVRGMAQLTLFERLREHSDEARRCIAALSGRRRG